MGSAFWVVVGLVSVVAIVTNGVVSIIKAAKSAGGKSPQRMVELEQAVEVLKQHHGDTRQRIEVLEKIVTDQKYDLGREIDGLAS